VNADAARGRLKKAFAYFGRAPRWTEWEQHDQNAPDYAKRYGSPTILVDGKDIAGMEPGEPGAA